MRMGFRKCTGNKIRKEPETMNKSDLIHVVAEGCLFNKGDVEKTIDMTLEAIAQALENDEKVVLKGFGTFLVKDYPARKNHHPKTKEITIVPPMKRPVFKAGLLLR